MKPLPYGPELAIQFKALMAFTAFTVALVAALVLHWAAESFPRRHRRDQRDQRDRREEP